MCKRILHYDGCNHQEIVWQRCFTLHQRMESRRREANRKTPWLNRLFRRAPREPPELLMTECTESAEVAHSSRSCPDCERRAQERARCEEMQRERSVEVMGRMRLNLEGISTSGEWRRMSPALREAKEAYFCIRCLQEERRPDQWQREVNGGFCCQRGVDEWEAEFGMLEARCRDPGSCEERSRALHLATDQEERPLHGQFEVRHEPEFPGRMLGIDEAQWNSSIQTGHGTIPGPPSGQLPPTPSTSTRYGTGTAISPRSPIRPDQLPTVESRPLPDIPNFRPGISDAKVEARGSNKRAARAALSPSGELPQPKLIKVGSIGRSDTVINVKPIVRHETEPLQPKGGLVRQDAFSRKAKTFGVDGSSNPSSSGLRRPFSFEKLIETSSSSSQIPQPSASRSTAPYGGREGGVRPAIASQQPQPSSSTAGKAGKVGAQSSSAGSKLPQPQKSSSTTSRPTALSSNPRQLQLSSSRIQKPLPPVPSTTPKEPKSPLSTTRRPTISQASSNSQYPKSSAPNLNKPLPPTPPPHTPRYSTKTGFYSPSSTTKSSGPASSVRITPSSSVRTTPPSNSRRPQQVDLSAWSTPFSSSKYQPRSSASPPKPRPQDPTPSSSKLPEPQARKRSPSPPSPLSSPLQGHSVSPVSITNSRWEEVLLTSAPQPDRSRQRSPSPVSPLSAPRPRTPSFLQPSLTERRGAGPPSLRQDQSRKSSWSRPSTGQGLPRIRWHAKRQSQQQPQTQVGGVQARTETEGQIARDQTRPQAEAEDIRSRRRRRGVITMVDDELEDVLAAWSGPDAMTRAERAESEKEKRN